MKSRLMVAAALLALAGCGGSESRDANGSAGSGSGTTASAASSGPEIRPGEWEMTVEMAGLPPEALEAMKAAGQGAAFTTRSCITPEQAKSSPQVFAGQQDGNCSASNATMEGGKYRAVVTCTGATPAEQVTAEVDGTYSAESWEMRQKVKTGEGNETVSVFKGRRIGDCPTGAKG